MNLGDPKLKKRVSLEFRLNARRTRHKNEFSSSKEEMCSSNFKDELFYKILGVLNIKNIFLVQPTHQDIWVQIIKLYLLIVYYIFCFQLQIHHHSVQVLVRWLTFQFQQRHHQPQSEISELNYQQATNLSIQFTYLSFQYS